MPKRNRTDPITYIYKDPEGELTFTSLRWRNALKEALEEAVLRQQYPALTRYFENEDHLAKKSFLDALRESGMIWTDSIEFPITTYEVKTLLHDGAFLSGLAKKLGEMKFERMVFLSDRQQRLSSIVEDLLTENGRWLSSILTVFPRDFWKLSERAAGAVIADALSRPLKRLVTIERRFR